VGKHAVFRPTSAFVHVGRDRNLAIPADPTCTGGMVTKLRVAPYRSTTARVVAPEDIVLPCERWERAGKADRCTGASGTVLGTRVIAYARQRLVLHLGGEHYIPPAGPVGWVEAWLTVGDARLVARFHNFRRNTATLLVTRKTSRTAAEGEAAF